MYITQGPRKQTKNVGGRLVSVTMLLSNMKPRLIAKTVNWQKSRDHSTVFHFSLCGPKTVPLHVIQEYAEL